MTEKIKIVLFALLCSIVCANSTEAKKKIVGDEARALFTKAYNQVYGGQGSQLTYKVNIVGIYKTQGTMQYKGSKSHYWDQKQESWVDGTTCWIANKKKHEVSIYRVNDANRDKFMSRYKFEPEKFTYSYKVEGNYYLLTAKLKESSFFGMKYVTLKVLKANLYPVSVKVKVGFVKTTVQISDFKAGNIADSNFRFPKEKFAGYTVVDHRNE